METVLYLRGVRQQGVVDGSSALGDVIQSRYDLFHAQEDSLRKLEEPLEWSRKPSAYGKNWNLVLRTVTILLIS